MRYIAEEQFRQSLLSDVFNVAIVPLDFVHPIKFSLITKEIRKCSG